MNEESKKIHKEYEELFGKAKRVNLFDTDEENEALHQYILTQPYIGNSRLCELSSDNQCAETCLVLRKDKNLITLEHVYPQISSPETRESVLMSIISSLEQNARKLEDAKINAVTSKEHEAQYFFRISGIVKAMGYYEPSNGHFFILKNSLLSVYSIPEFYDTQLGKDRAEAVETHCMLDKKYYRVIDEIECESASIAASYVIGNNAQYFMWKDASGVPLKNDHPTTVFVKANIKTFVNPTTHTFYLKRSVTSENYCNAHGIFDPKTNRFFIKAGSLLSLNVSPTFNTSSASLRRKIFLRTYCTKQPTTWLVSKDGACDSPSAAAAIVLGRNVNGRTAWVDKDGHSLNDIFPN